MKLMGMSGGKFKVECEGCCEKLKEVCAGVMSVFWTITYVIDDRGGCQAITVAKAEDSSRKKGVYSMDVAGSSKNRDNVNDRAETVLEEKEFEYRVDSSLRSGWQVSTRLKVDEACDDISAELVTSLKSFCIKEEQ
ncbi:unnamed protein product [Calypogeia fissa]